MREIARPTPQKMATTLSISTSNLVSGNAFERTFATTTIPDLQKSQLQPGSVDRGPSFQTRFVRLKKQLHRISREVMRQPHNAEGTLLSLAACRTEVFGGVATSGILPAIGKLAGRRAGVEAILAQLAGLMKPAAGFVPAEPALRRASG